MKTPLLFLLFALVLSLAPASHAEKADKKKGKDSESKPAALYARNPSETLSEFVTKNFEQALAPFHSGAWVPKNQPPERRRLAVSPSDSVVAANLNAKLQAEVTKMTEGFKKVGLNLPEPEQAPYARALELCSQFSLILNDRQTRFEHYCNSKTAQVQTLVESRDAKVEQKPDRRTEMGPTNKVFDRMEQEWLKVSTEYRQTVSSMLDLVRLAEKEARDTKAPPRS
jgi:hypothetical protein